MARYNLTLPKTTYSAYEMKHEVDGIMSEKNLLEQLVYIQTVIVKPVKTKEHWARGIFSCRCYYSKIETQSIQVWKSYSCPPSHKASMMIIMPHYWDNTWKCPQSYTSTPVVFISVREARRGRNRCPRNEEEFEVIERRCRRCWWWRSPEDVLGTWRPWWGPPTWGPAPPAGEVSQEALVDWKETDMPESREPTLPRRKACCPTLSVDHIATFTTSICSNCTQFSKKRM